MRLLIHEKTQSACHYFLTNNENQSVQGLSSCVPLHDSLFMMHKLQSTLCTVSRIWDVLIRHLRRPTITSRLTRGHSQDGPSTTAQRRRAGRKSSSPAGHPLWLLMLFQLIRSILNVTFRFHQFDLIHVLAVTPALASTFIKLLINMWKHWLPLKTVQVKVGCESQLHSLLSHISLSIKLSV